jgi:hypothetical protein
MAEDHIDELVRAAFQDVESRLLYPVPEARALLGGIGHTTIYELMKTGQLERVNIGRRTFITAKSLVAYLDRLCGAATAS